MRIVICAAFYPPYRGGYAESVRLLAEGLVARGNAVTVVACDEDGFSRTESVCGVSVVRIPAWNPSWLQKSFPIPNPFAFWRALTAVYKDGFTVVSTQTRFFPSTLIGFVFAKLHQIPVCHTERGASHTASDSLVIRLCGKVVDHTIGWIVCRNSHAVVGVSNAAAKFTRHLGAKNPITIYNGIDTLIWKRPTDFVRNDVFLRVVFVGRLVHAKGVQDFFYAVSPLLSEFPAIRIDIVGDGPYRITLENCVRKLTMVHAVVFHGALNAREIRDILWHADVLVNPSHSEGFPRAVLEAAAVGMPILATDSGGTKEIIENGVQGILVPCGDCMALTTALRQLILNASLRAQMGTAAHARAHMLFSTEKMIALYETHLASYAVL